MSDPMKMPMPYGIYLVTCTHSDPQRAHQRRYKGRLTCNGLPIAVGPWRYFYAEALDDIQLWIQAFRAEYMSIHIRGVTEIGWRQFRGEAIRQPKWRGLHPRKRKLDSGGKG